jgi:2,3,4,5-tetrahydropyridine-2-carboxylate N-succinyltransferase
VREAVEAALEGLDAGHRRVAEKEAGVWRVNQWLKKAVLLSFRLTNMKRIEGAPGGAFWWDKIDSKFAGWDEARFRAAGFRAVPGAVVRRTAFIAKGVVLMPSFINLGAYVDEGTMVDTWATIGSCAQIGKNCHISGGAGIGGVLEPLQANPVVIEDGAFIGARSEVAEGVIVGAGIGGVLEPIQAGPVIIEDNCFIGARAEVAEGVIVGEGSVLSMGVYLGQSTKIVDRASGEVLYGRVPPYSVVVPGTMPAGDGKPSLYCAVIVKRVDEKTRAKTSINELLRD